MSGTSCEDCSADEPDGHPVTPAPHHSPEAPRTPAGDSSGGGAATPPPAAKPEREPTP